MSSRGLNKEYSNTFFLCDMPICSLANENMRLYYLDRYVFISVFMCFNRFFCYTQTRDLGLCPGVDTWRFRAGSRPAEARLDN